MPDRDLPNLGNRLPTHARMRAFLENVTKRQIPVTYRAPARAFQILSSHSIHRVAEARERLMEEDAEADRPSIRRSPSDGLAAPGFFDCVPRVGRFAGDPDGEDAWSFHDAELNAVVAHWGGSRDNSRRRYHVHRN